jgi:hypothetical protein
VLHGELGGDGVHIGLGLRQRHSRFESSDNDTAMVFAIANLLVSQADGRP